eukprot:2841294-Rhodomonas_salina.1
MNQVNIADETQHVFKCIYPPLASVLQTPDHWARLPAMAQLEVLGLQCWVTLQTCGTCNVNSALRLSPTW